MGDYDNGIVPGEGSRELTNLFPKLSSSELSVYRAVNITGCSQCLTSKIILKAPLISPVLSNK